MTSAGWWRGTHNVMRGPVMGTGQNPVDNSPGDGIAPLPIIPLVTAGVVQPAATFSRASAATWWDGSAFRAVDPNVPRVEGGALVIERAATNTAYQSTDIGALSSSSGTITRREPFGVGSWATLTANADGSALLIGAADGMTVGETYTISCYARARTRDQIFLQGREHRYPKTIFDLAAGAILSEASEYTSTITLLGTAVFRCSIRFVADTAGSYIVALGFTAQTGDSVDFYGRQLERGPGPTSLIATGNGAATRAADVLSHAPATAGTVRLIGTDAEGTAHPAQEPLMEPVTAAVPWAAPAGRWSDIWVEVA
ncbi:hypothetical protein F1188_11075 [Roseospira marina]|uniref:Uncharacterized protein n=1 Tax=Roseospira marina TaxID=140057 RepID=A0A5M6IB12_9PROT|nr:hypothetical protein [Roseospira marina]KAA5605436.1 hypothetical protein F1188_11075 [Roseospira marina]MBB4314569.1 hypothetical protein [Roseospira marina]MBB5088869.1 hypothetical protein [Roseospira marina]